MNAAIRVGLTLAMVSANLASCGAPKPHNPPQQGAGAASSPSAGPEAAPQLDAIAADFVAAPGSKTAAPLDWESLLIAQRLIAMRQVLASASANEEFDPFEAVGSSLNAHVQARAKEEREAFIADWKGDGGCKAVRWDENPFDEVSESTIARLPPRAQTIAHAIKKATVFDVECQHAKAVLVLSDTGEIIMMEPPEMNDTPLDDPSLSDEMRYI